MPSQGEDELATSSELPVWATWQLVQTQRDPATSFPVIGAMGGNVGSQSSTIVVRGFATGRVDFHNLGRFLFKELIISTLMGIACGVLSGVVAIVWHGDPMLSVTVAVSMVAAIVASALMGVLVPYFFRLVKIDPAIAAGPLVTTIDDIIAIGIYYVVAPDALSG
jgi:magnesium transporter